MAIYGYTKHYKFIKPQFDTDTWHDYEYTNLDMIDAILASIFASGNFAGIWQQNTHYSVGDVVIDEETSYMYQVNVEHTTDASTFAEYWELHPTYYTNWNGIELSREWAIKIDGPIVEENVSDYSSKAYAVGFGVAPLGSSKEWATSENLVGSVDYSAKSYANSTGVIAGGSSKEWAESSTAIGSGYSAKSHASSSGVVPTGSAFDWATKTTGAVSGGEYSAKQYALNAQASANNALGSEAAAEGYSQDSADSAAEASTYATNAASSATAAQTSATNSANSASAALASQNAAATSAANAFTSETNAATSASDAADSADEAAAAARSVISGFGIFDFMFSDHIKNDMLWLRADTFSWQYGSVYEVAYDHLVDDYNAGTTATDTLAGITITYKRAADGHKICAADQHDNIVALYNAVGVAWYFILDTANERFKLPRDTFGFVGLRGNAGDYVPESLPNITGTGFNVTIPVGSNATGAFSKSTVTSTGVTASGANQGYGLLNFDASDSSGAYQSGARVQERAIQCYLYFFVGNFTQTAVENTAGITTETFNSKADVGLGNVTADGKSLSARWSMPYYNSSHRVNLSGYTSASNKFTAPCDGLIIMCGGGTANNAFNLVIDDDVCFFNNVSTTHWVGQQFFIRKGSNFYYYGTLAEYGMRHFFPLEGAQ